MHSATNHRGKYWWCLLVAIHTAPVTAATLEVPDDFDTIQEAIDEANANDTVLVEPGTYTENLVLRSQVNVRGREAARTILQPSDRTDAVVTIDGVNDLLFANITLTDFNDGIAITNSTGIDIVSNVFDSGNGTAVDVGSASIADLVNNVFWNNLTAVERDATLVTITNNIFASNTETIEGDVDENFNVSFNCFDANGDVGGGLGTDFQTGDPRFVDTNDRDFHLREGSPCIDTGTGTDIIDDTQADIGAYGGDEADVYPFPVDQPSATDTSAPDSLNITLTWDANLSYLVTNTSDPGSYRVWYSLNTPGPPYDGIDAGGGTDPSPIDVGNVTSYQLTDLLGAVTAPDAPQLLSAAPGNTVVTLSWTAASGATGYEVHYGIDSTDENTIDVGDVTSYTVRGLTNGTVYVFAVSAVSRATYYLAVTVRDNTQDQNESAFSSETSIGLGDTLESGLSNQLAALPEEVVPYPDLPDRSCFIATAAFGADWHAQVQILRDYRDRFLYGHAPGEAFVEWYYRHGPRYADYIERSTPARTMVRGVLWPVVVASLFMLESNALARMAVVLLTVILAVLIVRRRRQREVLCR